MAMKKKSITVFLLTMINLATILSIRNWPLTAEFGFASIFYIIVAALVFLLPVSFVSAELATGWPHKGGIFVWVKEALGHRWGFLAVWLLWVENVVYYPLLLSFVAGSLAFVFAPSLADSPAFTFGVILISFWLFTLVNLRGMKTSGWISTAGVIVGTLIPGLLIIGLGVVWYNSGHPLAIEASWSNLVPKINSVGDVTLLTGIILAFAGMEMPAVHANDVVNPKKNFPIAIFLSAALIIVLSILGSLAIAFIIPQAEIGLTSGSMATIYKVLHEYNLGHFIPVVAIMVMMGALGTLSTWIVGPCRGLLAAAEDGDFPPIFHKENKSGMPIVMMVAQGIIVTLLALAFFIFPTVNSSVWILAVMASQLYLIMYAMMFISAIVLRYKKPKVKRAYKIPGGNLGMWIVSGIGFIGSVAIFLIGFFPPEQLQFGKAMFYETFLVISIAIFCAIPFVILRYKKPSWASTK